jgi:polyhydroxyalkanoate synthesis regulator phasin
MNRRVKLVVALIVAFAVLGGGLFSAVAFAQTPTPPADQSSPGDVFWTTLADKLGVSVDKAKSAFRDAAKAVVAQAVKNGKLTQAQADKLDQRIDQLSLDRPPLPILPPQKRAALRQALRSQATRLMVDTAANGLGLSPQELVGELRDGLALAQIAQQKGVVPDKLRATMLAAANTRVDQAVKNGRLTQDQADALKARIAQQLDLNKNFPLPAQPPRP